LVTQPTGFSLRAQNRATPQGVKVVEVTDQTAKITWTTEEAVQSLVYYGLNSASLTLVQSEATSTTNHAVEITGLLPASTYYLTINVGKERFTNASQPWQFKTGARQVSVTPQVTPTAVPQEVSLAAIKEAIGKNDPSLDLNGDGVVSAIDARLFLQREASGSAKKVSPTP
jgi:hypothetical protein